MTNRLSLEQTLLLILVALLAAMAVRVPVDTDTWWHLRSADHTLTHGMIHTDPFSHTFDGERWINHSWGGQIALLGMYRLLGDVGLSLFTALLAVGGMLVLLPVMRGSLMLRAFLLVLAAAAAAVFWSARPQMLSFFLSAVFLNLLVSYQRAPSCRVWLLVPLMAVWANLHAGYSIGFIFMGAFVAGMALNRVTGQPGAPTLRQAGTLVLVGLACAAALVLTPYGLQTLLVPFETVNIGALRQFIQEWNSPNFQRRETWPFIGMVVLSVAAAWGSRAAWDWVGFLLWSGTLFMALLFGRNIAVFAVAALPVISGWVDDALSLRGWVLRPRRTTPAAARLNLLLIAMVWAVVVVYIAGGVWARPVIAQAQARALPVEAVAFLNERPSPGGNLFNSYNWGGYVLFAAPERPVFIDGRTDLYGDFLRVYLEAASAVGDWRGTLARYDVGVVLVERGSGLDGALSAEPGWRRVYADELAVIHERQSP